MLSMTAERAGDRADERGSHADRSMLVIQYAIALICAGVAGLLGLVH